MSMIFATPRDCRNRNVGGRGAERSEKGREGEERGRGGVKCIVYFSRSYIGIFYFHKNILVNI